MKTVFVFAYKSEAQSFLDRIPTRRKNFPVELYESTQDPFPKDFLITQEGHYNASEAMSIYFALQRDSVEQVINLGVAGVLQQMDFPRGSVFSIRTSYAYAIDQPEYESFTLCNTKEGNLVVDCISSTQRVDSILLTTKLGYIAPLVDRELWYIARICKKNKVPLLSYKSVLDFPIEGEKISLKQVFSVLPEHSESLYQLYRKEAYLEEIEKTTEGAQESCFSKLEPDFYCTFSQTKELEKWRRLYRIKFSIDPYDLLESVRKRDLLPKERTQELLKQLIWAVDPQQQQWQVQWNNIKSYYNQNGITISAQPQREPIPYEVRFTAATKTEYQRAVSFLQEASFPPITF